MALSEYLPRLTNFYIADGTGALVDSVGGINFAEVGTVALNSADGPPPELAGTSRGPCISTTTGFRYAPNADAWDFRNVAAPSGPKTRTIFAWYRFDTLDTNQNIVEHWEGTAASNGYIWRYENAFQSMILHLNGATADIDTGAGATGIITTTGKWYFGGFSVDGTKDIVRFVTSGDDDVLYSTTISSGFGGFANTDGVQFTRVGLGSAGGTVAGQKGDIAYLSLFNHAFDLSDFTWFFNQTKGQIYPSGYTRIKARSEHYARIRRMKSRGHYRAT